MGICGPSLSGISRPTICDYLALRAVSSGGKNVIPALDRKGPTALCRNTHSPVSRTSSLSKTAVYQPEVKRPRREASETQAEFAAAQTEFAARCMRTAGAL